MQQPSAPSAVPEENQERCVARVVPHLEGMLQEVYAAFAWKLVDRTLIRGRDHRSDSGQVLTQFRGTIPSSYRFSRWVREYVRIEYGRGPNHPQRDRLRQLEHEYFALRPPVPPLLAPNSMPSCSTLPALLLAGLMLLGAASFEWEAGHFTRALGYLAIPIGGLLLLVWMARSRLRSQRAARESVGLQEKATEKRAAAILRQARMLWEAPPSDAPPTTAPS